MKQYKKFRKWHVKRYKYDAYQIPPHLDFCLSSSKDKNAMTGVIFRNINKNLAMDQYMYFSAFSARTRR